MIIPKQQYANISIWVYDNYSNNNKDNDTNIDANENNI